MSITPFMRPVSMESAEGTFRVLLRTEALPI